MADFEAAVAKTIVREGGSRFTNDPDDPGGPTRYGIAQNFHPGVQVETLTEAEAKAIYRREYWDPLHADDIREQGVAEMLFDAAVNIGVGVTIRLTRAALNKDATLLEVNDPLLEEINNAPGTFAMAFTLAKIARYVNLCLKDPVKKKYFFGWVKRALDGEA